MDLPDARFSAPVADDGDHVAERCGRGRAGHSAHELDTFGGRQDGGDPEEHRLTGKAALAAGKEAQKQRADQLKRAKEKFEEAVVTLTEADFGEKCAAPDAKTPKKLVKRQQEILERFDYNLVHSVIRDKVKECLAAV